MNSIPLYRPVGIKELELIMDSGFKKFPPRLSWQPIFYPVLNQPYAEQIAAEWNTTDAFSGYCGIVTAFEITADHYAQYTVQNVGDSTHNELWVPAEELENFNSHIIGDIRIVQVFFGESFTPPENSRLAAELLKFR
ncbi:ADP-ribosylation/crystallin J1 [Chitinophaga tropicalis]|uniref:ADP-ribosylation/crystallin J1 n=1 Tax=Chitinophaga tropicalis TaxID=2683588 RepID=A0A7K1U5L5_9BACT|nr:ADP-ribosylation/crystallin J1 [Chitinophaga tropicalis]MVT09629.1 ADP-ribosylation/crystallin J1 [Chitinophaga tropicalis]